MAGNYGQTGIGLGIALDMKEMFPKAFAARHFECF